MVGRSFTITKKQKSPLIYHSGPQSTCCLTWAGYRKELPIEYYKMLDQGLRKDMKGFLLVC